MNIEAGQWWRIRHGNRVYVVGKTKTKDWIVEDSFGNISFVMSCGRYTFDDGCYLVEHLPWCTSFDCKEPEPPKPKKVEGWVNVYPDGHASNVCETKRVASINAFGGCVRNAFIREVNSDEELLVIARELSDAPTEGKIYLKLKAIFGGPSDER